MIFPDYEAAIERTYDLFEDIEDHQVEWLERHAIGIVDAALGDRVLWELTPDTVYGPPNSSKVRTVTGRAIKVWPKNQEMSDLTMKAEKRLHAEAKLRLAVSEALSFYKARAVKQIVEGALYEFTVKPAVDKLEGKDDE